MIKARVFLSIGRTLAFFFGQCTHRMQSPASSTGLWRSLAHRFIHFGNSIVLSPLEQVGNVFAVVEKSRCPITSESPSDRRQQPASGMPECVAGRETRINLEPRLLHGLDTSIVDQSLNRPTIESFLRSLHTTLILPPVRSRQPTAAKSAHAIEHVRACSGCFHRAIRILKERDNVYPAVHR